MWLPETHSLNMNGPVPTGARNHLWVLISAPDSSPRMCFGSRPAVATRSRNGASTAENWKTTVCSSGVSTREILFQPTRPRTSIAGSITTLCVKATSADVNGLPSCHLTPFRSLNV